MEARLFDPAAPPEWVTADWYAGREHAPHLEQDGHRERLMLAAEYVSYARRAGAETVVDLGAGDGGLLSQLPQPRWGYDLQPTNVEAAARRGVNVILRDVVADGWTAADVTVATEFLEHLIDPHGMAARIRESGSRWLVASSPYMETAETHYEFHLWAWDIDGYRAMLESAGWQVRAWGTRWICQVMLCEAA